MKENKPKSFFTVSFLKNHIDRLLFIMAVIVLAAGIVNVLWKKAGAAAVTVPVTLKFTQWWRSGLEEGALENLIDEYEKSRENVKIVLDSRPYEETKKLLFSYDAEQAAAEETGDGENLPLNDGPGDILAIDELWTLELFKNKVLDTSFPPPEPLVSFFYPLFYNIEMLKAAGFDRPPKTRKELSESAAAVTDPASGRYGIAFALGENNSHGIYRDIYPWFWAAGYSMLAGSDFIEETLSFFSGLQNEKSVHPEIFSMSEEEKREAFIKSKIAFMTGPVQDIVLLRREMGENAFGISAVPAPDSYSGKPVFGASGWSAGVFRNGKHKEEAADFVSFLAEKGQFLAEKARAVPGGGNSLSPEMMKDPFYSKAWELYISGELIREFTDLPGETEREAIFREELRGLFDGNQNASSAAEEITKRWSQF